MNSKILGAVVFIYLFCAVLYLCYLVFGQNRRLGQAATLLTLGGFGAQTVAIVMRWVESYRMGIGHAPLSNMYESLIFFAWTTTLIYLLMEWRTKQRAIGAFVMPFAFVAMAYASWSESSDIMPLVPALQSNWLLAHVITCFLGYAAFAVACGLSIMYLIRSAGQPEGGPRLRTAQGSLVAPAVAQAGILPNTAVLDNLIYQTIIIGFTLLSAGIVTGAAWAHYAWGSYWSWDPKETWSLITWFIYASLLHARFMHGWRGRKVAFLAVAAFGSVLFTYFGVAYLLPGLHSYASGG
jgi:cytochrome c-type biogenesis protein CcsB